MEKGAESYSERESRLIQHVKDGDQYYLKALNKLLEKYSDDDEVNKTHYIPLVQAIYLSEEKKEMWKKMQENYLSNGTFYRHRHNIVIWFEHFYKKVTQEQDSNRS